MRMSGLSKGEMSGFMGWESHGNGAYRLRPARKGSIKGAAGSTAKAFDAGGGRPAASRRREKPEFHSGSFERFSPERRGGFVPALAPPSFPFYGTMKVWRSAPCR